MVQKKFNEKWKKMSLIFGVAMTTSPSEWHKQLHIMKAGCLLV